MTAVYRRELLSYFASPIGYVFLFVFYLTSGFFFYITCLAQSSADLTAVFYYMFWVMLVFIPILTMRLFADDKKQKTDQLTLTSPLSLFGLVMGKFLSALTIFAAGMAMILVYALTLSTMAEVNWELILANLLGMLLMGMLFIAVGIMVSAFTENQMIASVGAFMINLALLMVEVISGIFPEGVARDSVQALSVFTRYVMATYGIFDLSNILFFLSFTAVFIFFTIRILERRRWS